MSRDPQTMLPVVAYVTVQMHDNGALSISGNIGDHKFALRLLDEAKDAIRNQIKSHSEIVIPNRDVSVKQDLEKYPTVPFGDMPRKDWGDIPL